MKQIPRYTKRYKNLEAEMDSYLEQASGMSFSSLTKALEEAS